MTVLPPAVVRALAGALEERPLTAAEVEALLAVDDPVTAEYLFAAARELRARHFGSKVFLYGFLHFSTYCRNHCTFCFYRRANGRSPRYRKSAAEVVEIAVGLATSGVHLVDLTMGEDPSLHDAGDFGPLIGLVGDVRAATGLPIMVSPGVVSAGVLAALRAAGADWYACYQETHTPTLFRSLRTGQSYRRRAEARGNALRTGLRVEDGIMLGVGEVFQDRVRSLLDMREQGVQQVRVMGFVPQEGTPLADMGPHDRLGELVTLATMRLVMPDRLIPASLDIEGLHGLRARLQAGANVVTSIIPPASGLAGVSQATLDIDGGLRTVAGAVSELDVLGLQPAGLVEYRRWLDGTRGAMLPAGGGLSPRTAAMGRA